MAKSKAVVPADPLEVSETEAAENPGSGIDETGGGADVGAAAVEPTMQLIYIGPQLPRTAVKPNTVLTGTEKQIKEGLADVFERFPLAEKMLVPVEGLADSKDKIRTAGTLLNKYYADLVSAAEAVVKEG